jgi:hypothetical protein
MWASCKSEPHEDADREIKNDRASSGENQRASMRPVRRNWPPNRDAARATRPQNLAAALRKMQWQGTGHGASVECAVERLGTEPMSSQNLSGTCRDPRPDTSPPYGLSVPRAGAVVFERAIFMKAIDRVMAAYAKVYKLTDEQANNVRKELTSFIEKLLDGRLPEKPEKSN